MEARTIESIAKNFASVKFDQSKINNYYTSQFLGFSVKGLTNEELVAISKSKGVKEIHYDQLIPNPIDEVTIEEGSERFESRMAQVTPCGISNAGGFADGSSANRWIWIIDTGVDSDHPDLNVITDSRYAKSYVGGTFEDCNGHGTHVAGTAAAKDNGIGVVGVSAGAPVVPLRVFGCSGGASSANILAAINQVGANDIAGDVVNMSLGGFYGSNCSTNSPYASALTGLSNAGTRIALAAGNSADDATRYSPACVNATNIYTVASMTCSKGFSSFSNFNRAAVDVIATGSSVQSTWLNGGYRTISGTSMASPTVAGILHVNNGAPRTSGSVSFNGQTYPIAVR
ncbi:MAG: S8 family serine peptidase [Flavobacterium sp.]|nr:S8 family serine peptidase [Flavobacterium sp.]